MFSMQQKRDISTAVQNILRETQHPELPTDKEMNFQLHVEGKESWSWADIKNNNACKTPSINLYNEQIADEMHNKE